METLNTKDIEKCYKTMLHNMIDNVNDIDTLMYLYSFSKLYIKDAEQGDPALIQ